MAEIVVEDDGPGVPEAMRDRVFEPFEQGDDASEQPSPGTGIGLSLVRRFVELHEGTVSLAAPPGGGARVTVRLPVSGPSSKAHTEASNGTASIAQG